MDSNINRNQEQRHSDPDEQSPGLSLSAQRVRFTLQIFADLLQRLVCLVLAAWNFLSTHDLVGTLVILALGFLDARFARKVLGTFLGSLRARGGSKEDDAKSA